MSSPRKPSPKKVTGKKKAAQSRSDRAGLTMPVGRIARMLKEGKYASRIGKAAPIFIASVLEYLVSELIDLAGKTVEDAKKKRINPRFLNLAIRNDEELSQLLHNATISGGGVKPHVIGQLSKTKGKKSRKSSKKSKKDKKDKKKSSSKKDKKSSKDKKDKKDKKEKSSKTKAEAATQEA